LRCSRQTVSRLGELAHAIGVLGNRIHAIINGSRSITGDTDLRVCKFFDLSEGGPDWGLRADTVRDLSAKQPTMLTVPDANVTINEGGIRRLQFCKVPKKPSGRTMSAPPECRGRWYLCLRCEAREALIGLEQRSNTSPRP